MAFRFSGHETFPCRYAWLPKAYKEIISNPATFADDDQAMIRLGVGKNMVHAIRFWMQEMGVASKSGTHGYEPTPFANAILGRDGFDPFLEDIRTLWLIHWNLSTHKKDEPLFAWNFLLNHWQAPEISRSEVLKAFRKSADSQDRPPSDVTLAQHFDIFLHTYVPTRTAKATSKRTTWTVRWSSSSSSKSLANAASTALASSRTDLRVSAQGKTGNHPRVVRVLPEQLLATAAGC